MSSPQEHPITLDPNGAALHAEGARLRAHGPATRVLLPDDVEAWSINSHELLQRLLTDPRVSKDSHQHWPRFIAGEITPQWPLYPWISVTNMFTAYGTDHRRLRRLVAPAFTAHRTALMRPTVQEIVDSSLDALPREAVDGVVDLRRHYAYEIPVQVVTRLMGVPEGRLATGMRQSIDNIFNTALSPEQAVENYTTTYQLLHELVAHRRAHPAEDMTSVLITTRGEDDETLTEAELVDTLLLIIAAGHETTVNLLDNAIHSLLGAPDQLDLIRTGAANWSDAVEESLRVDAPVAHLPLRYAVEDIPLDQVTIRQGDAILASYAAAGQDPAHHGPSAATFDITRAEKDHLAFGYGVHYCLGAPLARMEAATALPALFDRYPGIALAAPADGIEPVRSFISNGHSRLPATLT